MEEGLHVDADLLVQRSRPARLLGLAIRLRAEITAAVVGLLAWRWLTGYVSRRVLAVLTRHRLRAVFVERRVMNWSGNLPVLLWSRPTPVGERVWVLLRAGINGGDIERNLDHVASGSRSCHRALVSRA